MPQLFSLLRWLCHELLMEMCVHSPFLFISSYHHYRCRNDTHEQANLLHPPREKIGWKQQPTTASRSREKCDQGITVALDSGTAAVLGRSGVCSCRKCPTKWPLILCSLSGPIKTVATNYSGRDEAETHAQAVER